MCQGPGPGEERDWEREWERCRVQGHWQATLRAGATCNALFMMQSGAALASAMASRALLPRLLLQLRESCGSCQRFVSRSYPQKKKIEKSKQKVHRKSERAGHTCAVLRDRAIKLQFWQVSQAARNPFSFERKCLWSGVPTWSRSRVRIRPASRVNCQKKQQTQIQLHSRSPKVFPNYITVSRGCERVSERGKVGEGERRELRFSRRKLRHRLPTLGHR